MKVSIITLSRNHGDALEATIRGVTDQSLPELEHIVIDAASTDNTLEVLARHPRIRHVSEPDRGFEDAFHKGLAMATGTYIACCNIWDEYIDRDWLRDAAALMDTRPDVSLVWGRFADIDPQGHRTPPFPRDFFAADAPQMEAYFYYYLLAGWPIFTETTLVAPKEIFLRCFNPRRVETGDHDAWFDFFHAFHSGGHLSAFLPRVVNTVKTHDDSRVKLEHANGVFRRRARTFKCQRRDLRNSLLYGRRRMVFRDRSGNPLPVRFRRWRFWRAFLDFKVRLLWFKKVRRGDAGWKHPEVPHRMINASLRRAGLFEPSGTIPAAGPRARAGTVLPA